MYVDHHPLPLVSVPTRVLAAAGAVALVLSTVSYATRESHGAVQVAQAALAPHIVLPRVEIAGKRLPAEPVAKATPSTRRGAA